MSKPPGQSEGLRERKRRETLQRLAETGLRLFLERGYDQTTLDAIAEAAGVSRRTLFHYFDQKEDILLTWKSGLVAAIRAAILREKPDRPPLDIVLSALLQLAEQYQAEDHIRIDRLLASTDRLGASKLAKYAEQEQAVFEALVVLLPASDRRERLRLVAMASVGALRLALELWAERGGAESLADHLRRAFADLKAEIGAAG
jgi:AcrR family transcriptional regulator